MNAVTDNNVHNFQCQLSVQFHPKKWRTSPQNWALARSLSSLCLFAHMLTSWQRKWASAWLPSSLISCWFAQTCRRRNWSLARLPSSSYCCLLALKRPLRKLTKSATYFNPFCNLFDPSIKLCFRFTSIYIIILLHFSNKLLSSVSLVRKGIKQALKIVFLLFLNRNYISHS